MINRFGSTAEFTVQLHRDSLHTPWGFRMEGGIDFNKPLVIQRVIANGAAEGELHPGDVILSINHQDTSRMTHEQATELILSTGGTLILKVARGNQLSHRTGESTKLTIPAQTSTGKDAEETTIPQNRQLASLMNESLRSGDPKRNSQKISNQGYKALPWARQNSLESDDITVFLPRLKKTSQSVPSGSGSPRESQIRSQVRESLLRSPSFGSGGSGRSTPTAVLELGSPGNPRAPVAVGIWVPPTQHPNSRLVHLQYNSPLSLYTPHNVADMIQKQTGQKLSWQKKPAVRFLDDIRDSPTYKLVQEIESPEDDHRTRRAHSVEYEQSQTIKNLNRYFNLATND